MHGCQSVSKGEVIVAAATQPRSVEFFFGPRGPNFIYGRAGRDKGRSMDSGFDLWLQLGLSAALLLAAAVAVAAKRRWSNENVRLRETVEAAASVRLMALALLGQGKLDAAWQKFQEAPSPDALLDDFLALAGAFEKAGQAKKAMAVLRVVQERKPGYKDVDSRMTRARQRAVLARAAEAKPLTPERPKFGAFEAEKEIGRGAVGTVYLGRDPVIGREVAIKTLPLDQEFASVEARAHLFDEVRAAGALSHPNIITLYDAGEAQGVAYIAMELLQGGTLAAHVAPGKLLPAEEAVEIVARAAEALGHAHREGVVHRDVRPGNIMVQSETGLVKVTDFGIAHLTSTAKSRAGDAPALSPYLSPEQRSGETVDGRSDLYSLGVTLSQVLTGKLPTDMADLRAEVPAGLGAVVARAVAADPAERFQTGEEFSGALRGALQAGAVPAGAVDIQL